MAGAAATYNYDLFGRLDTITAGGTIIERNVYDGFDHVVENRKTSGGTTAVTRYTFDPLDRTTGKTSDAGTAKEKTTNFNYLGLSGEVLDEDVAGTITKSYQYSPWGQRLSQVTHNGDGTTEDAYYGYNPHTDVETLTDEAGDTKATYGYTAYGNNDTTQFTGIDKPDTADPTKEPYNAYRFNAKRWDQASGTYDMGFRDYNPGLNRFLVRDSYNGALADLNLGLNPWTGNRYAFGGGNPITNVEIDGHDRVADGGGGSIKIPSWIDYFMANRTEIPEQASSEKTLYGAAGVYDKKGNLITSDDSFRSGGGLAPGENGFPLTDQDVESRVIDWYKKNGLLQEGNTVYIKVNRPKEPCANCGSLMQRTANEYGVKFVYDQPGVDPQHYAPAGKTFVAPKGKLPSPRVGEQKGLFNPSPKGGGFGKVLGTALPILDFLSAVMVAVEVDRNGGGAKEFLEEMYCSMMACVPPYRAQPLYDPLLA